MTEGYVESFDKTRIYYKTEGSGLPLVCCYGVVCNSAQWKHQTKQFKKKYQIIHFDYRGHNKSSSPKKPEHLTIKGCARDLDAVLKKLNIKKAVLMGHSMGVNVILQYAALFPNKVAGLVTICGTADSPFKSMFNTDLSLAGFEVLKLSYLRFPNQFPKLWKKTIPSPLSTILTSLLGFNFQLTKKKEVKHYLDGVAKQPTATFFHFLQEMHEFKGTEILKKVEAPTLIIGGKNDLITPIKNQYAIYRRLKKNAAFLRVPQGSHCAHIDMPELVNLRIEKFLNSISYR